MNNISWVILILLIVAIALWIYAIADIFGGAIQGSGSKILWLIVVIFFPIVGVILYFIFGKNTQTRSLGTDRTRRGDPGAPPHKY